jgi:hypothetical protein
VRVVTPSLPSVLINGTFIEDLNELINGTFIEDVNAILSFLFMRVSLRQALMRTKTSRNMRPTRPG